MPLGSISYPSFRPRRNQPRDSFEFRDPPRLYNLRAASVIFAVVSEAPHNRSFVFRQLAAELRIHASFASGQLVAELFPGIRAWK